MRAVTSLSSWIKANTNIKAEDVIIDALPGSTYFISGNFSTANLKMFVGFIERSEDAGPFAQIIYKWAAAQGRPLREAISVEALSIDSNTWDYYFTFEWVDKNNLGEDGEAGEACPIPVDQAEAFASPEAIFINDEEIPPPSAGEGPSNENA